MGLCLNVLGSGSSGNTTLVSDGSTHILVDAGLSGRETAKRLLEYGLEPEKISAIVISHEHGDHCRGVAPFVKKLEPLSPFSVGPMSRVSDPPLFPVKMVVAAKVIITLRP